MIETNIEKRIKQANKYVVPNHILNKNSKEIFADLYYSAWEQYCLLYSLLEDIEFSIFKKECTDLNEIKEFISKWKDVQVRPHNEDYDLDD